MDKEKENEFNTAYDLYADMLYKIAYLHTADKDESEDVLQEVFIKLLYKSPSFKDSEHKKAWLIKTTTNQCKDFLKSSRRKNLPLNDEILGEEIFDDNGRADTQDHPDVLRLQAEGGQFEVKAQHFPLAEQIDQRKHTGGGLANHRGPGRTGHAPVQHRHKEVVQHDVHRRGDGHEHGGVAGVAHAAQNAAQGVVERYRHIARRADNEVGPGDAQNLLRCVDEPQDGGGQGNGQHEDQADQHAQRQAVAHDPVQLVPAARAHGLGHIDLAAGGDAHEAEEHQHSHIGRDAHRAQGVRARVLPHKEHIHQVVAHLKQIGQHQRQRKADEPLHHAAFSQIVDKG